MPSDSSEVLRRPRPAEVEAEAEDGGAGCGRERCPRCLSRDTKFCYYNNYNTAQPRHFCKSCRRYWTLGGTLRNVPIGGSSRKRLRRHSPSAPALRSLPSLVSAPDPPAPAAGGFANLFSSPAGFLGLGEPGLMDGRTGFELGLGLGLGPLPGPSPTIEELGFGTGTSLLWPTAMLEDGGGGDAWRVGIGGEDCFAGPAVTAAGWREFAVSSPGGEGRIGPEHLLN